MSLCYGAVQKYGFILLWARKIFSDRQKNKTGSTRDSTLYHGCFGLSPFPEAGDGDIFKNIKDTSVLHNWFVFFQCFIPPSWLERRGTQGTQPLWTDRLGWTGKRIALMDPIRQGGECNSRGSNSNVSGSTRHRLGATFNDIWRCLRVVSGESAWQSSPTKYRGSEREKCDSLLIHSFRF